MAKYLITGYRGQLGFDIERELKKRKTIFSNVHRVKSEQSQEGYKRRNETNERSC